MLGYTPGDLYHFTLAEFMNAFAGFNDNHDYLIKQGWEQSRYILSGLVKDPKPFPWHEGAEGAHKPYTEEEKKAILEDAERREHHTGKKQVLTQEGWKDVDT